MMQVFFVWRKGALTGKKGFFFIHWERLDVQKSIDKERKKDRAEQQKKRIQWTIGQ